MIIKKFIKESVEVEYVKDIKCDCCKVNLLKEKNEDETVGHCALLFSKSVVKDFIDGDLSSATIRESSDFCEGCYEKIIAFLRSRNAKVPSFFINEETEDAKS